MRKIVFITGMLIAGACNNQPKDKTPEKDKPAAGVFPVTDFIRGQIHMVDSFQSITFRYVIRQDKTDTSLISIPEFKKLAQTFLHPELSDSSLLHHYTEASFADQSGGTVVFNYTARNPELEVQRVDIVVDANPVLADKVRSVYEERRSARSDTFITEKLYWRTDKNFQIISSKQVKGQPELVTITKVVWDN